MNYENVRLSDFPEESDAKHGSIDLPFLLLTIILLTVGVVMVLSASFARAYYDIENETGGSATYYFTRQLVFAALGIAVMFMMSRLPMSFYRRISFPVLAASVLFLLLVPLIGIESGGARRWINLGFTTFQPSEVAKVGVILSFASMICRLKGKMSSFKYGVLPFALILSVIVGLLLLEPHISASVIIIIIGAVMLFIGGAKLYLFVGGAVVIGGLGALVVSQFSHASARITTWLDPLADSSDAGYQIVQSLYSIGSGGLLGLGLGQSRQKYLYLPEEHNDFIFSVVCEELGFIGAALILLLFSMLIVRGLLAFNACKRQIQFSRWNGNHDTACTTGNIEHSRFHKSGAVYRNITPAFQLWRNGAVDSNG